MKNKSIGFPTYTYNKTDSYLLQSNYSPLTWLANTLKLSIFRPVFIFAHPDDATLSAFFALANSSPQGLDVVVCAGQPKTRRLGVWDTLCGFLSPRDAWACRLLEHNIVNCIIGLQSITLNIIDGQYGNIPNKLWLQAQRNVLSCLQSKCSNIIFTHSLYPDHPDHRLVINLAYNIAVELNIPIVYTCDRPYFAHSNENCISSKNSCFKYFNQVFYLPSDIWNFKQKVISIYESQHNALSDTFGQNWYSEMFLRYECYSIPFTTPRKV